GNGLDGQFDGYSPTVSFFVDKRSSYAVSPPAEGRRTAAQASRLYARVDVQVFDRIGADDYEQIVFCHDRPTGLRAVVAIHSTVLGPSLGGTRFYPYTSEDDAVEDVLRLARGMTYKSAAAGLDLGGGKAVILGGPAKAQAQA